MTRYQYCSACDARTGRCEEDSLYSPSDPEEECPLCEECYDLATAAEEVRPVDVPGFVEETIND